MSKPAPSRPSMWSSGPEKPRTEREVFGCAHCGMCPHCGKEIDEHERESNFGDPGYYELRCPR